MLPIFNDLDQETRELIESLLPAVPSEFVQLIGLGPALAMFSEFGGMEWRFSKSDNGFGRGAGKFDEMAAVIGKKNALLLADRFGCEPVYISRCHRAMNALRNRQIIADFDALSKTLSSRETCNRLAKRYRTSQRSIEKIVNGKPQNSRAKPQPKAAK